MPISDEIIELEPVKKSKSKLIIMFVIMGVLFALAITFLVLYLLKPNVEENTGRINEIIGETSALFVDSNGEESKNIASVNNTYTVYVDVSAEGTADPKVIWEWQPRLAIEEIGHGSVGDVVATSAEGEAEPATRFYFSFKPSAQYADGVTPVTITARSTSDQNKHTDVTFYIVNQGTENIEIQKISHDGGAYTNITYNDNGQISLPYYSNDENNKIYAVSFRQLGKFNPTTGLYSDLTRQTTGKDGQPTYKVDIDTDKKDSVITNLRVVDSDPNNESFRFKLCGSGEATITLTANNYNDYSAPISVSIKIKAESTDTLGYIDDIRIYDRPVDDTNGKFYKNYVNKQYTATNYGDIPSSSKTFVMPYGVPGYNNFLQHIVLLPLSVQYNPDGTRKSDWMNHINVTSSLNELLTITKDAQKNVVLKSNLYGADNNCTLSVTSTDKLGVIVSKAINVNIVAQNTNGTITVKKEGQSANEDVGKKISTSQGQSLDLSVTYFFTAPSDIETEGFVTSNCLSKGYTVSMKSVATEQEVKNFVLTPGSGTKAIEWNKQQSIDTSMVIAKTGPESSTRYTGTVNFKLAIPSDRDKVPDGDYFFTFTKIGTPGLVDTAGRLSELDKTWSVSFTLDVTAKARTARFISEDKGAEIARLDGNKGNFIIENDHKARLYLQNRAKGSLPVGFDFKNFVEVTDGVCTKNVACTSPTTHLNIVGSTGNQTFEFSGKKNWVDTDVQGKVTIKVKNNAEEEIGIFEIDVYLIDAIEFIVVEEKGDSTFNYNKESIASGGKSFVPDRILNDFIFRQEDDIKNDPKKKYNEAAHDNFELLSHIGEDLAPYTPFAKVKNGNNIQFKYPDKNGTTVFEYVDGKIYPRVDLFEFSYNNNINVTSVQVKYSTVPDDRFETEIDIKECAREYTYVRDVDDVALFNKDDYAESSRIEPVNDKFRYEINMGDIGSVYSSAVVNIKKTGEEDESPVVVKYAAKTEDHKQFITALGLENVYIQKPGTADDNFKITNKPNETGYHDYIKFTAPNIAGDEFTYSAVINGVSGKYTLDVVVLNRARPISSIELFDSDSVTALSKLDFGEYGNAHADTYTKKFFVKANFVRFSDPNEDKLYTQFEPVTLTLPSDKYVLTVGGSTYTGSNNCELVTSQFCTGEDYYIWECTLTLAADATDKSGGALTAADKFADNSDETNHKTASAAINVGTGVESIDITLDGITHTVRAGANQDIDVNFVLYSATAPDTTQKIEIPFSVNPYSASFGDKLIKYDLSKLIYAGDMVDGLKGEDGVLHNKLILEIDPENAKVLNGEYVFTLTDSANSAGTVFKITVNVSVKADIYQIELADKYTVTTSGADSGEAIVEGTIKYNGGDTNFSPDSVYKQNVEAKVVVGGEGSTETADSNITVRDYNAETGAFKIAVSHAVIKGEYHLYVVYTNTKGVKITKYAPIEIKTDSNEVKWLSKTEGNVEITDGTAAITVENAADEFKFAAGVYNRGSGAKVDGATVSYAIYDKSEDRAGNGSVSTVAIVADEKVRVTNPQKASDTLYLRASYVDTSSGKTFYADVDIKYTVVISSLAIDSSKVDAETFKNNTLNLYYLNGSAYTTLDLTDKISVQTAFGIAPVKTPTITITSGSTDVLTVSGFKLTPKTTGKAVLTITATDDVGTPLTKDYDVNIIGIDALTLYSDSGSINVVENGSVNVARVVSDEKYGGLIGTYKVSSPSKFNVGAISENKSATVTVDRSSLGAIDYGTDGNGKKYTLTATVDYKLKVGSSLDRVGKFSVVANYELTVFGSYTFDFDVYVDGVKINENSVNEIKTGSTYKVVVKTPSDAWYDAWYTDSDWTYTAADNNGIVNSFGAFTNDESIFTFDPRKAGVISVAVTANAYGKSYVSGAKEYTFSYGGYFTTKLQLGSVGSAGFTDYADKDNAEKTLAVDYGVGTAQKVIRYVIDTSDIGDSVSDVKIDFLGTATAGELTNSGKLYYRDFTLGAKTTLILSGSFIVGGRTYITDKYTLTLNATEPEFTLTENGGKSELGAASKDAFETATFKVGNTASGFEGATTVSYSIISGGDRATIDAASGVLTPELLTNSTGGSVVVRATVNVTSGVFAGKTYNIDAVININGVTLPTLTLIDPSIMTNRLADGVGTTVDLSNAFTISGSGDANCAYTYAYTYTVKEAQNLISGDYVISGSTLTVNDTLRTKAGGKIKVTIRATVTSAINKDAFNEKTIEVVIKPRAHQSDTPVNVSGDVGTYDIKSAVAPYTYDQAGFVNSTDDYTVVYTLAAEEEGISVNGDRLIISNAVKSDKQVTLNAKLTFNGDGSYKGTTVDVSNVVINIRGLQFNPITAELQKTTVGGNVTWSYKPITVKATELSGVTVKSIVVTIESNAAFASITDNGTTAVNISVDKDFNIAESGTKKIDYSAIIGVEKDGIEYTYYGEGEIDVGFVKPELVVTINGEEYKDNASYSLYVGDSFNLKFAETHGFEVASVTVSSLGDGLTCVDGGVNQLFTAIATRSSANVKFDVQVGTVNVAYNLKIAVTNRPAVPAFTATNTDITLFNTGSSSYAPPTYGSVLSVLTPSSNYQKTTMRSSGNYALYIYSQNGYLSNYIQSIILTGYTATGTSYEIAKNTPNERYYYMYLNVNGSVNGIQFVKYDINFTFKLNSSSSIYLNANFYWANVSGNGSSTYCSFNYRISRTTGSVYVTYNSNGGSYVSSKSYGYGQSVTAPSSPTKSGYEFAGWYTTENPDPDNPADAKHQYVFGRTICSSMTLYAGWRKKGYQVTYNPNGGMINGSASNRIATSYYGEQYANLPTASDMSRDGYDFDDWWTATSGGTRITSASTCTTSAVHTLYARWTPRSYNVSFNANGGELDELSMKKTVTFGEAYGTLPTPERSGYKFVKWHLGSVGGSEIEETTVVTTASAHALYAEWTEITNIVVTFDANGGSFTSGNSKQENQTYNAGYVLPATNPTRDGYRFVEWVDAAGNPVTSSSPVTNVYNHTLYAKWAARNDISIKLNDGTTETSLTKTYGGAYALPTPTRDGYTFKYWYVSGGDENTAFTTEIVGSEALVDGGLTLNAKWEANTYYVFLNHNDGSNTVETKSVKFGDNYSLPTAVDMTRTGYTFAYWYTVSGSTETEFDKTKVGSEVLNGLTLYAKWTAKNDIAVTFSAGDGSFTGGGKTVVKDQTYDENYILPETDPTRDGYTFVGWVDASGNAVTASTVVTVATAHTISAKWTERTDIVVTFDAGDGSLDESSKTKNVTFNGTYGILPTPTRTGYTFAGWLNATSESVTSTTTVTNAENHTLTAKWTQNTYTVTFNANGGSLGESSNTKTVTYKSTYGELPVPTKTGYDFANWHLNTADGNIVESTSTVETAGNHTLVAKWTAKNDIAVTFSAGDGSFTNDVKTVEKAQTYDGNYILPETNPTRIGYTFIGWVGAENKPVTSTTVVANEDAHTINAKWEAKTCYVFLNYNDDNGTAEVKNYTFGSEYSLPTPTRDGYQFEYWYTKTGNTETEFTETTVGEEALSGLILYVKWAKKVTVTFDAGDATTSTKTVLLGKEYGELPAPTKTGYTLAGWLDNTSAVTSTTIVTNAEDHTLTAKWTPNTYTVTFDANGGSLGESEDTKTVTYKSAYGELPTPTKTGYNFVKWHLGSADGTGVESTSNVDTANNHTLVAEWEAKDVTVTFNAGYEGASAISETITVTFGSNYTAKSGTMPATPTREGYTFDGWYAGEQLAVRTDGTVTELTVDSESPVLTAKWAANTYKVTYNTNGGTFASEVSPVDQVYGEKYAIPATSLSYEGFAFAGWWTEQDGGTEVTQDTTCQTAADHTLYAHWTSN